MAETLMPSLATSDAIAKYELANVTKIEFTSNGTTGNATTQYLIYNFTDGTKRQYEFTPTGINCKYYNGSTWSTLWTQSDGFVVPATANGAVDVTNQYRMYVNTSNHVMTIRDKNGNSLGFITLNT